MYMARAHCPALACGAPMNAGHLQSSTLPSASTQRLLPFGVAFLAPLLILALSCSLFRSNAPTTTKLPSAFASAWKPPVDVALRIATRNTRRPEIRSRIQGSRITTMTGKDT